MHYFVFLQNIRSLLVRASVLVACLPQPGDSAMVRLDSVCETTVSCRFALLSSTAAHICRTDCYGDFALVMI